MIRKAEHYRASGKNNHHRFRRFALASAIVIVVALLFQFFLRQLFFYPLKVTGDSMSPEIQAGEKRYFVYPKLATIKTGDVVLVRSRKAEVDYLCRIVAVDGDKVRIQEGRLILNGNPGRELNPALKVPEDTAYQFPEAEVRPNHFFCLNDNARNSADSRLHGIFERGQIVAKLFKPRLFF
ncbi:MAG: signal peptidase I [Turneriella sp.]